MNFDYPTYKSDRKLSHFDRTTKNDTVHLIFHYGFNGDIVTIKLNGKKIYKKEFKYINAMPTTGDFEFRREKETFIQIYINRKKTKEFKFDNNTGDILGSKTVQLKNISIFLRQDEDGDGSGGGIITYEDNNYKWIHQTE